MAIRRSAVAKKSSISVSIHSTRTEVVAHPVNAPRIVSPGFARRRLVQLIHLAVGASASSMMLGAHAQSSGNPCGVFSPNACLITSYGNPGSPAPGSDFDKSGKTGGNASGGATLSSTFNGSPASVFWSAGYSQSYEDDLPAIGVESVGGNGGGGSDASGGKAAPIDNLNGGSGGTAGAGGGASLYITQGAQVQAVMSDPPNVYYGDQTAAIYVGSEGGTGGGGGVPSSGGTEGTSQNGGAAGNVTVQDLANPNQTDPTTGITAAVIGYGTGIEAVSFGGDGGSGNSHVSGYSKFGVDGGDSNAPGGTVTVTTGTSIVAFANGRGQGVSSGDQGAGIWAVSAGGNGGAGGSTGDAQAGGQGGTGGAGAPGGSVTVTVQSGSVATQAGSGTNPMTPAVWAQSLGGIGGTGGKGGGIDNGGNAGAGGDGGSVSVTNNGALSTAGAANSPGILAQSFGGAGAGGGTGGGFGSSGGEGATGGDGGNVAINGSGTIATNTTNSPGVLAQSIGGGGGNGGSASGWLSVGGAGAGAGSGASIFIDSNQTITTTGRSSAGITAQSIGGGGGNGGDATGTGVGINLIIGGSGGAGGGAYTVLAYNGGSIVTSGQHSSGLELQSIGGGGGKGGSAFGDNVSAVFGAQESVGGSGGNGGSGSWIGFTNVAPITNAGSIRTSGSDSFGIVAQSIGGGGGIGAASVAASKTYAPDDTPSLSLSAAIGGSGGGGGDGDTAQITNAGMIATSGAGGIGMITQSIGGGGGAGGDSSATSSANGSELNIDSSVALGGKGGGGGNGNAVNAANNGLIVTTGESADGILAQSIGGGGGNGGSGDAQASASGDGTSITASIPIGGKSGGGGSTLGLAQASNSGAILTLGDGASGITAQAVGGGGGRAGGAAGTSKGDFSATVSIGGSGGSGGSANLVDGSNNPTTSVQVTNSGSIVTFGGDASAIVAQSIGGGGGLGGKAATSIGSKKSTGDGGNGSSATNPTLDALAAAFKAGGDTSQYTSVSALSALASQLLGNTTANVASARLGSDAGTDASDLEDLGEDQGDAGDDSNATSIKTNIAVGGSGGAAGNGGIVQVANTGSIGTIGVMSDGVLVQSIGGGGGKGGAATSSGSLNVDQDSVSAPLAVGGSGGAAGSGSDVTVTNDTNASITTIGSLANGIVAQSIGGGGGMGGVAGGRNGALQGLNVSNKGINVGGDEIGKSSDQSTVMAGTVTVNNNAGASILTESHDASGIIAQSIAGGGGIVKAVSTDAADNAGGGANADPIKANGTFELNVVFGGTGSDGSNGSAGAANVNNSGSITTDGRNAYGVLAQSVGGGGGLVLGGEIAGGPGGFMNTAAMRGNGGDVNVTTNSGSTIVTSGQGAIGIFAQSVGGGGGIAGDTGLSQLHLSYPSGNNHPGSGNGGTVDVTVNAGSSVQTSGANAPAIIAQSVGGGGGYFTAGASGYAQGLYAGSFGGSGSGGAVNVNVSGYVGATGSASPAIYAQSSQNGGRSTTGSPVTINVNQNATVSGGADFYHGGDGTAAAIQIFDGYYNANGPAGKPANVVNVNGLVTSVDGNNGSAVFSYGGTTFVHNGPTGVIDGTINLQNNGGNGSVQNDPGGKLNTGATVAAALTQNNGTLDVGGQSAPGAATLVTGDLQQGGTGSVVIDSDHVAATSDRLIVVGNATLAGQIVMRPTRLTNSTLEVIDVKGSMDASQLKMNNPYLVNYTLSTGSTPNAQGSAPTSGQSLYVTPHANFAASASGLSANAQSVASHLQANFDAGANAAALGTAFAIMANGVANHAAYNAALNRLGNETQQAVGSASLAASHAFVERMYSCPTFDGPADAMMHERDCVWGRIIDNHTSADGSDSIGYSANTYAMQFGGQHGIGNGWFIGGSVGYDTSNLDGSDDVGDVNGHGPQVGVVLKKEIGNWTISGGADAGYGWYDSTRNVTLPGYTTQAKGDFNAFEAGLHSRVAYTIPMSDWYMKPYLDLHVVHFHSGSYTEQGAGALDLAVNGSSATTLSASPMFEVGGRWTFANGMVMRPDIAAGAVFHNRNHWDSSAQFVGSAPGVAPFTAESSAPTVLAKVKLDMNFSVSKSTEIKLEYGGQFGSGYSSNEGILRVNHLF